MVFSLAHCQRELSHRRFSENSIRGEIPPHPKETGEVKQNIRKQEHLEDMSDIGKEVGF